MAGASKTSSVSDRRRVNAIIREVAKNPEGAALIALARREKIRILLSGRPRKVQAVGLFSEDERRIDLERSAKNKDLAEVLAHELRHLWQSRIIRLDTNGLSAADSMAQRRLTECDAFAYQIRFQLAPQQAEFAKIKKSLAGLTGKQHAAALKEFNKLAGTMEMKAFFLTMQSDMDDYDRQTIKSLKLKLELAELCVKERKLVYGVPSKAKKWQAARQKADGQLKALYNEIARPRPPHKNLPDILREGLDSDSPKYFRYQSAASLSRFIRKQIPQKTLREAQKLEQQILTVIENSGVIRRRSRRPKV